MNGKRFAIKHALRAPIRSSYITRQFEDVFEDIALAGIVIVSLKVKNAGPLKQNLNTT
jgi:hypothetical protein